MQATQTIEPILISINETCAKLRIGRSTFYNLVMTKKLDIKKISPKCTRVTVASIHRYVASLPTAVDGYSGAAKAQRKRDRDELGLGDKPRAA